MNIGEKIRITREKYGLTQNALAERAGISQSHLRRVELGIADITVGHLQLICDALELSLCDFFQSQAEAEQEDVAKALSRLSQKQKRLLSEFLNSI